MKEDKEFRIKKGEYWLSESDEIFFVYYVDYEGKEIHFEEKDSGVLRTVGFEYTEQWFNVDTSSARTFLMNDFRIKEDEVWLSENGERYLVYQIDHTGDVVCVEDLETGDCIGVEFKDTEEWVKVEENGKEKSRWKY